MKNRSNLLASILLSLLPWPALYLVDRASRPCGDGLCGFFPSIIVIGGLLVATIVFLVRAITKKEEPMLLQFLPLILWLMLAKPLFL